MRKPSRYTQLEAEIQALIATGNFEGAYNLIDSVFRGKILTYCNNKLRGYPGADGEMIAQNILDLIFRKLPSFDPFKGTVYSLLSTILRNRVIDEIKRLKSSLCNSNAAMDELQYRVKEMEESNNPERLLFEKQRKEAVDHAIDKLSTLERAIVILYLEERTIAEIARILGIKKANSIPVKYYRIQKKIRESINTDKFSFLSIRQGRPYLCMYEPHREEIKRLVTNKKLFTLELGFRSDYPDMVGIGINMWCKYCHMDLFGLFSQIEEHFRQYYLPEIAAYCTKKVGIQ